MVQVAGGGPLWHWNKEAGATISTKLYRNQENWWLTLLRYIDILLVLTCLWHHSETKLYRSHGKRWLRCCRFVTFTLTEGIVRIDSKRNLVLFGLGLPYLSRLYPVIETTETFHACACLCKRNYKPRCNLRGRIWQFPSLTMVSTGNPSICSILYSITFEELYKISFLTVPTITPKSLKDSVVE
jgi:hypothetical protein